MSPSLPMREPQTRHACGSRRDRINNNAASALATMMRSHVSDGGGRLMAERESKGGTRAESVTLL